MSRRRAEYLWNRIALACLATALLAAMAHAADQEFPVAKKRQQGILTGMPFMANLASRTFVDDLGRKIYLAKPPSRIVSLAPSITETLYALGAQDQLVGVTPYCDYPPEATLKPKVGYIHPNLESVVALQPDLVLAPREFLKIDILAKLEQLKIPVFIFEAKSLEDVLSHIQTVGRILERQAVAQDLSNDMRRRIAEVKAKTEGLPHPKLLYVLNSQPLITVGPGSFIHQLIEAAGGANVAHRARNPYPRLNMEEVIQEDPDLLLFPVGKAEGVSESEQQLWQRWSTLSAVKHQRFHQIPSDILNRPGPRVVQALEALAKIIHPEAFPGEAAP